jgi:hypothetical protein
MNTLDDLRRVLEADAGDAPRPDGVAEAAVRGAARIRRRRRLTAATGAAVLVAAVTVAVPVVADRRQADGPPPASTPSGRRPGQVTLTVDPASDHVVINEEIDGDGQRIMFRSTTAKLAPRQNPPGAIAIDPDVAFDPGPLRAGERITVSGHEAWYVAAYPLGIYLPTDRSRALRPQREPSPVIGWRDPGGTWILVYQDNKVRTDRAALLAAAEAVRVTPPRELLLPVTLGRLPAGLPPNFLTTDRRSYAHLSLGGTTAPPDAVYVVGVTPGTAVTIEATPREKRPLPDAATPVADVAGHQAWYSVHTIGTARGNGTLSVRVGACLVTFSAWDEKQATKEDLRFIAEHATYAADCENPATWGPAVRR